MRILAATSLILALTAGLAACDGWPRGNSSGHASATPPTPAPGVHTVEGEAARLSALPPRTLPTAEAAPLARIAALLAQPPLRPLPATLPRLRLPMTVSEAVFAEAAGVLAVTDVANHYSVVDINNGAVIATGKGTAVEALSPNGRVLGVWSDALRGTELRDAQGGETLLVLPGIIPYQVHWIRDVGVVHPVLDDTQPGGRRLVFRDLATGLESTLAVVGGEADAVLATPGQPDRFGVASGTRFHVMTLDHTDAGWRATITSRREWHGHHQRDALNLSADRRFHFSAQGEEFVVVDLATGGERMEFLPTFNITGTLPTADPDQVLLGGVFRDAGGARRGAFVYSLSKRTLARIDEVPPRPIFIPSLRINAAIAGDTIAPVTLAATGAPGDLRAVLSGQAAAGAPRDVRADLPGHTAGVAASTVGHATTSGDGFVVPTAPVRMPVEAMPSGGIGALANGARIVGVGVYEPRPRGGSIVVQVPRARIPVVLVLASYEPVKWVVAVAPGAEVRAVLLSGYHQSTVIGTAAPQFRIGTAFAYQAGSTAELDALARSWTGRSLDEFHGGYAADGFALGQ